jgi:hypothetical protein
LSLGAGAPSFAPRIKSVHELIVESDRPEISAPLYSAQLAVSKSHEFERIRRAPHPQRHRCPLQPEQSTRDADSNQNDDKAAENPPGPRAGMTSNLSPLAKVRE